eukprot:2282849-Rhodomonas_salina.2
MSAYLRVLVQFQAGTKSYIDSREDRYKDDVLEQPPEPASESSEVGITPASALQPLLALVQFRRPNPNRRIPPDAPSIHL